MILEKIKASWRENLSKLNNRPGTIIRYPRVPPFHKYFMKPYSILHKGKLEMIVFHV